MRALVIVGVLIAFALVLAAPPTTSKAASCSETSCGVPSCSDPNVRVRPDITRAVRVSCSGATSARLVTPPAHGEVSNVSVDWSGLHFDAHLNADSPRYDEAVFELGGHEGSIEQRVNIEVLPTSENSPPVCGSDRVARRSDGTGPVDVYIHPNCWDPDRDEFVIRGGPPGVHLDSPKTVGAGFSDSNWRYRTATFSGEETTTIWATDELGARSADAQLEVTVGPAVDRPPECSWNTPGVVPIWSRPGMTRRFPIVCSDADGDPFTPRLSSPPERGALPLFIVGEPQSGYPWMERWIDATYVPPDDSLESDPFSVTASGAGGDGPAGRYEIVPRELPANGGGSCGWSSSVYVRTGEPGDLRLTCDDGDGDPLSVEIVTEPRHGTLAPAVITPARYGQSDIKIPYVSNVGYEGYDCVKLKVIDGHGLVFEMSFDIWVWPRPPPIETLPPLPPLPPMAPAQLGARSEPVRNVVERILGTTAVRRLRTAGGGQVWARSELSRRDLVRYGRAPGLVVLCPKRCQIRSDSTLATGLRSIRASRRKTVAAAAAGQPQVLSLAVGRAERRALGRARKARARFKVSIRAAGEPARSLTPSVPVSR
jgi:hypothetical protein